MVKSGIISITPTAARRAIYITHLSLANFRNYERLELDLQPGMTLFEGGNGAGKSNLIEAAYMLAIARSHRAGSERELARRGAAEPGGDAYARIAASARRGEDPLRLQIDIHVPGAAGAALQKRCRVNGAPRRAAALVGLLNAVMFSADDLEIVYGSPSARRRYLNILIAQADAEYLRALRGYERVLRQRNSLLRRIRDRSARADELAFWDDELAKAGAIIMARRRDAAAALCESAKPIYADLSGARESVHIAYSPNAPASEDADSKALADGLRRRLAERRSAEIARGATLAGPHRDDLLLTLDGLAAVAFASRGQTRTLVLALKLAEGEYLARRRMHQPVILMDDVLSELDAARRLQVMERASAYGQALITTADANAVDGRFLASARRFRVSGGALQALN